MKKLTDSFGNSGYEMFEFPVSFARKGRIYSFIVSVAADSYSEAVNRTLGIPKTPSGSVYFDAFKSASEATIVSVLESIDGIYDVSVRTSDSEDLEDYSLRVDEEDDGDDEDSDEEEDAEDSADSEDEDDDEDGDEEEEYCDEFGNHGEKLWWVPVWFALNVPTEDSDVVVRFNFKLKIAGDDKDKACANAELISLDDFLESEDLQEDFSVYDRDAIVYVLSEGAKSACEGDWEDWDGGEVDLEVDYDSDIEECCI